MKLNLFNGGLNIKPAPHFIKPEESRVCINMDLDIGTLSPVRDVLSSVGGAEKYGYFSSPENKWYFHPTPADWVEFQGTLYFSDRVNAPVFYFEDAQQELGVATPTSESVDIDVIAIGPTSDSINAPIPKYFNSLEGNPGNGIAVNKTYTYAAAAVVTEGGIDYRLFGEEASYYHADEGVDELYVSVNVETDIASYGGDHQLELYRRSQDDYYLVDSLFTSGMNLNFLYDRGFNSATALKRQYRLSGTYEYAVTYQNSSLGDEGESGAYYIPGSVTANNQNIELEGPVIIEDPNIDIVNLYRVGGGTSTYTKVKSFSKAELSNPAADTYIIDFLDTIKTVDLPGPQLTESSAGDAFSSNSKPKRLKFLVESYAVFFAVLDYTDSGYAYPNRLYFTPVNEPNKWPTFNFLTFPIAITGIAVVSNGLLVFTASKTYLVTGVTPQDFSQFTLSSSQGCINHDTIANINKSAVWVSKEGLCISDGSSVEVISEGKLGLQRFNTVNAAIYNQKYYLCLNDAQVLEADLQTGQFRYLNFNLGSVLLGDGKLYGYRQGNLFQIFHEQNTAFVPFEYLSPVFIGESFLSSKVYKYLYISAKGELEVTLYLNGEVSQTYLLESEGLYFHELQTPKLDSIGQYSQFKITGTGTVYEIYLHEDSTNR